MQNLYKSDGFQGFAEKRLIFDGEEGGGTTTPPAPGAAPEGAAPALVPDTPPTLDELRAERGDVVSGTRDRIEEMGVNTMNLVFRLLDKQKFVLTSGMSFDDIKRDLMNGQTGLPYMLRHSAEFRRINPKVLEAGHEAQFMAFVEAAADKVAEYIRQEMEKSSYRQYISNGRLVSEGTITVHFSIDGVSGRLIPTFVPSPELARTIGVVGEAFQQMDGMVTALLSGGYLDSVFGQRFVKAPYNSIHGRILSFLNFSRTSIPSLIDRSPEWRAFIGRNYPGMNSTEAFNAINSMVLDKIAAQKMVELDAQLKAQGYNSQAVMTMSDSLTLRFSGSNFSLELPTDFKKNYDEALKTYEYRATDVDAARVAEMKDGAMGWFFTEVLEFKEEDFVKMARGKHPLAYFLGAISAAIGGKSFAWALPYWEKGKRTLSKSPRLASFVPAIEGMAKSVSGLVESVDFDLVKDAVPRSGDDVTRMSTEAGAGNAEVSESGKGMKLDGTLDLHGGRSMKIVVPQAGEVKFARAISGVKKEGSPLSGFQLRLEEGTYTVTNVDLPEGTYFSDGVQFKISGPAVAAPSAPGRVAAAAETDQRGLVSQAEIDDFARDLAAPPSQT